MTLLSCGLVLQLCSRKCSSQVSLRCKSSPMVVTLPGSFHLKSSTIRVGVQYSCILRIVAVTSSYSPRDCDSCGSQRDVLEGARGRGSLRVISTSPCHLESSSVPRCNFSILCCCTSFTADGRVRIILLLYFAYAIPDSSCAQGPTTLEDSNMATLAMAARTSVILCPCQTLW